MGVIGDLIKDIPLAAVLKEKLLGVEADLAGTKTENDILKADLRKANTRINQLEAENKRLTEQINKSAQAEPLLNDIAAKILGLFSKHSDKEISREWIVHSLGGDANAVIYYFDDLNDNDYIKSGAFDLDEEIPYRLTQKGRKYVIEHPPQ